MSDQNNKFISDPQPTSTPSSTHAAPPHEPSLAQTLHQSANTQQPLPTRAPPLTTEAPAPAPGPPPAYTSSNPIQAAPIAPEVQNRYAAASSIGQARHNAQDTGTNSGMLAGMAFGMSGGGGDMVGDMITGMVVGNMVGQRVGQAQARQAALSGMTPDGMPLDPNSRAGRRAERRSKRYERRAKRHDKIKKLFGGGKSESSSSGSEGEEKK